MKILITSFFALLILFPVFSNECLTHKELRKITTLGREAQNRYLIKKGYETDDDYLSDQQLFGNTWSEKDGNKNVAILWDGPTFHQVEYRLSGDTECFNSLREFPASFGFKKHSRSVDEYECEYINYMSKKWVLIFVKWEADYDDDSEYYYQVRLQTHEYFFEVDLVSQTEQPISHEKY